MQYTLFTHTSIRTLTRAEQRLFWLQYKYLAYLHNPTIFFGPLLFVVPFVSCGIPFATLRGGVTHLNMTYNTLPTCACWRYVCVHRVLLSCSLCLFAVPDVCACVQDGAMIGSKVATLVALTVTHVARSVCACGRMHLIYLTDHGDSHGSSCAHRHRVRPALAHRVSRRGAQGQ